MSYIPDGTQPVRVSGPSRKPRARKYRRTCPECAVAFIGGPDALFCTTAHKDAWHNRAGKRGKVAMPFLQAYRGGRGRKGDEVASWAFRELSAMADLFNEQDRKAGRMAAGDYLRPKMQAGWRAVDLVASEQMAAKRRKAA